MLHVKFKPPSKPTNPVNGRTGSGIIALDRVSARQKAVQIKRIFPDAGVFEAAHKAYGLDLWYQIELPEDAELNHAIEDYQDTRLFDQVEESRPYSFVDAESHGQANLPIPTLPSGSNDPFFSNQWHFDNNGQSGGTPDVDINLINAWKKETGSTNVIVAVIDGGINVNHPDLQDAIWVNADEIPSNGIDDDHNGYIDDVHGYGFGDGSSVIYPDDHASHVAGTIGAVSNNGIGVSGIAGGDGSANGVRLMSCAGFGRFSIGGFEAAMVYAADNGAVISQNSWGGGTDAIEDAIDYFVERAGYDNTDANFDKNIQTGPMAGGIVIFAAGNYNTSNPYWGYPASYPKVVAVASTDHKDYKSHFSNYGTWVDIAAPGSHVYSTTANDYAYFSGTSMACPHVSGVAALVISNLQRPGLQPTEIRNRLRSSARSIRSLNSGYLDKLGWGRVDAYAALREPDAIPPGVVEDLGVQEVHTTSLLLKWTASGEDFAVGQAADYEIRYSFVPISDANFYSSTKLLDTPYPPVSGEPVVLEVENLIPETTYHFALRSIDLFGNISPISNSVSARTKRLPTPELVTPQLSKQLFTGTRLIDHIAIKNTGDEESLLVRTSVPKVEAAPVIPPLGAKGRLFAINSSRNTIEELDTKSGRVIHHIPMPEPSSKTVEGLAFDGMNLYYGNSTRIFKIDAGNGEVIRTITVSEASIINGMAWSGRYLYVSAYSAGSYNLLEVDSDNGTIIRRIDRWSELAYLGTSNSLLVVGNGQLEEVDTLGGTFIRSIPAPGYPKCIAYSVVDSVIFVSDAHNAKISALRPSDGAVLYSFPYAITTALAGDEHPFAWLETNEEVISILPGQTGEIPIAFNTAGLGAGTWTGSMDVIPLNSNTEPLSVSFSLDVQLGTDIETATEIHFGTRYLGFQNDTTIIVENRGFSDLIVNGVQSNDDRITSSISSITLAPGQKTQLQINIEPAGTGAIEALVTFTSNDPDESVYTLPVTANLLEPPLLDVHPGALQATLAAGETTTLALTLTNAGNSALNWNGQLTGSDSTAVSQAVGAQSDFGVQTDSVSKAVFGKILLKSPSPEEITGMAYDPQGELIYARSSGSSAFYTYEPGTDRWNNIGIAPTDFYGQGVCLNGKIYYGGTSLNIYAIQSNAWSSVSFPVTGTAISLTSDDKYVYIAIGRNLYRFDPSSVSWMALAPTPGPLYVYAFGALSHQGGVILAAGIQDITGDGNTHLFKYFIGSNTWIVSASIEGKVALGSAVDISTARYFVLGATRSGLNKQLSVLDIREGQWSKLITPFDVGGPTGLAFVGKENASGIFFSQGSGNGFACYETASAASWFEITPTAGTLGANEDQGITVKLSARGLFAGVYDGNIRVHSAKPPIEANVPVKLTVTGVPNVTLMRSSFDVGTTVVGYDHVTDVTMRNNGTAALEIDSVTVSHPDFIISDSSFTVHVGESVVLTAYFRPTSVGQRDGVFTFHGHDPGGDVQFTLSGTGVEPAQLVMPADTLRATLFSGEVGSRKFTITNNGGSTHYLMVTGTKPWIKFDNEGWDSNIGSNESREFEMRLDAEGFSQGLYDGSIWVEDYLDPFQTSHEIPVRITVLNAAHFYSDVDSINFGTRYIGHSFDSTFQIKNKGVLPLSISSIDIDNPAFTISIDAPRTLGPGEVINAFVSFRPTNLTAQQGKITFSSNDPVESSFVIKLSGVGEASPNLVTNDPELIVSLFERESLTEAITLANHGGSVLRWRILEQSDPQPAAEGDFTSKASTEAPVLGLTTDPATGVTYAHDYWSQKVFAYNPQLNQWSMVGLTLFPEYDFKNGGAVILDSKMYCIYLEASTKIYVYDMVLKSWTTITNELGGGSATITTDGTLIYLAGGGNFKSYNPDTGEWIELPLPNLTLDGLGGLGYRDGFVYAHSAGSNGFARYSLTVGAWENLPPLPGAALLGGTIDLARNRYYAIGRNYMYEYDLVGNIWTALYFPQFLVGNGGGLSFTPRPGHEGVYFTQGDLGSGFARYEPKAELPWLRSSRFIGEIESMQNETIGINFDARTLVPGVYHGTINITTNDPGHLQTDIPVTLEVMSRAPIIELTSEVIATLERPDPPLKYLVIENDGKDDLTWSLVGPLPPWLAVNPASGSVHGYGADSIELSFQPALFPASGTVDYTLVLNSNDPTKPLSSSRLLLTLENHAPVVSSPLTDRILDSGPLEISLLDHFSDEDNDALDFSFALSVNDLVTASIVDSRLLITPIEKGRLTITLTAVDVYEASATASFEVNNLLSPITGLEDESNSYGLTVSPNPFSKKVGMHIDGYEGEAVVVLVDFTGRTVWRSGKLKVAAHQELGFDGSSLAQGLYACLLFVNDKLVDSKRLVKE